MTTPPLPAVLTSLLSSPAPDHITLTGKLTLAYTPGPANADDPGVHRLTLSRRGQWPSEQEVETVRRDLAAALRAAGRVPERVCVEWWAGQRRGHWYHVLFWREMRQGELL